MVTINNPFYYSNPYRGDEFTGSYQNVGGNSNSVYGGGTIANPVYPNAQMINMRARKNINTNPFLTGTNKNRVNTQPRGFSSLGQQMNAQNLMGMANNQPRGNTPPNYKNNLLNYILSPQGKGMAQGLLESSGYSTKPVGMGEAFARGLARSNEAQASVDNKEYKDALLELKKEELELKKQSGKVNAKARDIKIAELVGRGLPRNEAADIVDGNLEINFSETGVATIFNPATKEVKKYGSPVSESSNDSSFLDPKDLDPKTVTEEKINIITAEKIIPKIKDISARANNIFGTGNKFKDMGASVAGITPNFLDKYLIDPDVVQAKKEYGLIKKELELSLTNNPRFPVAEVQRILELLPNEKSFLQDPKTASIALNSIANEIQGKLDESKSVLKGEKITTDIMSGAGVQIDPFIPKTNEDFSKIKSGQYFTYNGELRIMK